MFRSYYALLPPSLEPKPGEKTQAPRIIEKVQSQVAADGSAVEFSCKVEGHPRPQITWFRQTAIIKPSVDFHIYYDETNKATLVIKEVFPEDAGTFTCVAKNCVGFASSSAELVVEHPLSEQGEKHDRRSLSRESSLADIVEGIPPTFAQRPQTKVAEAGTTAELECRFVAIPEAEVTWYHDKKELKEGDRVSFVYQADMHMYCSILRISDLRLDDAGVYEVCAKNREGEATNTLQLNVIAKRDETKDRKEPPIVVKPLSAAVCRLGDTVKMETVITGTPPPTLIWYHNGVEVESSRFVNIIKRDNIYTLIIDKVSQANDGEYVVHAENEAGTAKTSANLCVQGQSTSPLSLCHSDDNLCLPMGAHRQVGCYTILLLIQEKLLNLPRSWKMLR